MDTTKAENFFRQAYDYCAGKGWLKERESKTPEFFERMSCEEFLAKYCHVVYASGFRKKTIDKVFIGLRTAYHNFDLAEISRMNNIDEVLLVFNNNRKANSFVTGAKKIAGMGYDEFKNRVLADWRYLSSLKGIGDITVHHLAMDLGFDTIKPDLHVQRVSRLLGARDAFELVDYLLSKTTRTRKKMVVDSAIFEFCESEAYKTFGCATIQDFILQKC